ncbi:myocardin-related transcription factor B [Polypterus senegalus]|uniref:myocardin-related transcription factor B n=1 Tax=Polypterus senegalus TaxID=55291 RepID=UPI001966A5FF|nr:myocardin-related transcription factor B [Polypterus senegalus]XP_039631943.1 myocardin-related transcription factor B [Polypterus senegalus]
MEHQEFLGVQEEPGIFESLTDSPQSEAVAHELEELSLHPSQNLPPLNERKNVLQLRLQQRRTREQLVDQGIMPPLKSPAAFHEQIRSLERARTENFLKHKIRSRPERAELVRMHILQETLAEPSLQATQLKLKRARLADDLNEKISQRPGPMELVEKNILPFDSSLKDAIGLSFDEDSGDALSPDQPASQESQGSLPSPAEIKFNEASSPTLSSIQQHHALVLQHNQELPKPTPVSDLQPNRLMTSTQTITGMASTKPTPTLVKQSQPKSASEKSRNKKNKETKPRVKKLKYHQYIPPDQKTEPSEVPMDSSYARLLQQQQVFLQLQILSQQQQHYNYQTILPAPLKPVTDNQNSPTTVALTNNMPTSIVVSLPTSSSARHNSSLANRKPGPLPANLDDMKVAELKMELKLRGLPVSGTKMDLIERLKPYQDHSNGSNTSLAPTAIPAMSATDSASSSIQMEHITATPPASPVISEPSSQTLESCILMDTFSEIIRTASPVQQAPSSSPSKGNIEDLGMEVEASDKDRKLHEKERQIEELKRKLEQEQRLVEELKMQLEVEKRSQMQLPPVSLAGEQINSALPSVKEESRILPSCQNNTPPVNQEQSQQAVPLSLSQFFVSHSGVPQVLGQPHALLATIQLPAANISIQPPPMPNSVVPTTAGIVQAPLPTPTTAGIVQTPVPEVQNKEPVGSVQLLTQSCHIAQVFPPSTTTSTGYQFSCSQPVTTGQQHFKTISADTKQQQALNVLGQKVHNGPKHKTPQQLQPQYLLQHPNYVNMAPKIKDPPRYEEAVKQTRNAQAQVPTASSQQMDDLFDILIESGELSPFVKHEMAHSRKVLPVTASITTMPVNTVLSRPPPQVQVAPTAVQLPDPSHSMLLNTDSQLEAFLEGSLNADVCVPQPGSSKANREHLTLIEDIQGELLSQSVCLDQPSSPMDTSELHFDTDSAGITFDLHDTNLDNMEWLDIATQGPAHSLNPLGVASVGSMFSTDFLDVHDLPLHWD